MNSHHQAYMSLRACLVGVAVLLGTFSASSHAADDKIETDRPDFVESSEVVGKGRLQVETSFARERVRDADQVVHTTSTPTLLRVGVSDTVELRLESDGRKHEWSREGSSSGYADASIGMKWHVSDAKGNAPAFGVLLHADLPSGSAHFRGERVRPSLRLVGEWDLPADISLGVMPGISYETNVDGKRFTNGILGIVLGKELSPRWRGFVEVSAPQIARSGNGGSQVSFDTGVAYLIKDNCQVDVAVSHGLNKRTPDLSWTVGLSFKL
jgi:hypothetical protein